MTAPAPPSQYTATWLLSGGRGGARQALAQILHGIARSGGLGQLTDRTFTALNQQLTEATYGLLTIDLGALLRDGWRLHAALAAAGRATLQRPASTELVELAKHTISVRHQPAIDLYVNEVKLATIALELLLKIEVDSLLATVRDGRLVELRAGRCTATATLSCESVPLASGTTHLEPAFVLGLGRGLALVREALPRSEGVREPA
jgi:hypothetical protein